jgi:hypothetical protein
MSRTRLSAVVLASFASVLDRFRSRIQRQRIARNYAAALRSEKNLNNAGSNYGFQAGLTPRVRGNGVINVIKAIYYPATANGYWFGDTDSKCRARWFTAIRISPATAIFQARSATRRHSLK